MDNNLSILFVSDSSPNPRLASAAIFYRHLCRLEDHGADINLLLHGGDIDSYRGRDTWRVHVLPTRQFWHPPFRPYNHILARVRYEILERASRSFIRGNYPNVILGYLRGTYFSGFAAHLARCFRLPLGYFYHDATELFPEVYTDPVERASFGVFKRKLIQQAEVVWAVSRSMLEEGDRAGKMRLLYPLADDVDLAHWPEWTPASRARPVVAHAGTIYNETVEPLIQVAHALAKLNGRLLLLTDANANARCITSACPNNVEVHPTMLASEACAFISCHANAMLVAYPPVLEQMPWIASCFPSKFVQFTATGLPTWLLAPLGSALRDWAEDHHYPGLLHDQTPEALSRDIIKQLGQTRWEETAAECRRLWKNDFCPDRVHTQFENEILALLNVHHDR